MATTTAAPTQLETLLAALTGNNDSSKSNSTSSAAFNTQAGAGIDALLRQISGLTKENAIADSTGMLQQLSQTIMQQQMPSIANQQRGAGLYNSTTQQQLLNDLQARTTVAGQEALQQNIQNYSQASTAASQALAGLNNSTQTQQTTATKGQSDGRQLGGALASLLVSQGLGSLKRKAGDSAVSSLAGGAAGAIGDIGTSLSDSIGSMFSGIGSEGLSVGGGLGLSAPSSGIGDLFGGGIGDALGGITTGIGDIAGDLTDGVGGIIGGIGDIAGDIGSTIGDAFSDFGSWTGWWANGGRIPGAEAKDGKDNKIAGVGGGEVILPLDTVAMLDAQLGEDWVEKLINATHTNVIPDPTPGAKKAAAKAIK